MNNRAITILIASIVTVGFAVLPAMAATASSATLAPTAVVTTTATTTTTTTPNDWINPGWD